jgi:transposase
VIAQGAADLRGAFQPADMRLGSERLGALVRERMRTEPRSRALFAFVGKRGHSMKVLTWDGTGTIVIHKKLDAGRFELPRGRPGVGEQHVPGQRCDLRGDPQGRRGQPAESSTTNPLIMG